MKHSRVLGPILALAVAAVPVARADQTVVCELQGHDHHYCAANTSGGVTLVRKMSHAGCWQGDTWGYDRSGIWVSDRCRGVFSIDGSGNGWSASGGHQDWGSSAYGVTLYRDLSFSGTSQVFEGDIPDLRGSTVGDDAISSIRVRCN
jgi:hypothetical protein